jgi:hypothetical protein
MRIVGAMMIGATLMLPVAAAQAQSAPGWQQTLQGLMTGNQNQDQSLREAYQRGYDRGRQDEAQALHANNNGGYYHGSNNDREYGSNGSYGNGPSGNNGYNNGPNYQGGYNGR